MPAKSFSNTTTLGDLALFNRSVAVCAMDYSTRRYLCWSGRDLTAAGVRTEDSRFSGRNSPAQDANSNGL
jgi:hypothetical protein